MIEKLKNKLKDKEARNMIIKDAVTKLTAFKQPLWSSCQVQDEIDKSQNLSVETWEVKKILSKEMNFSFRQAVKIPTHCNN